MTNPCNDDAKILCELIPQTKYAIIHVIKKTKGIAIFAEILRPTRKIPANNIGENASMAKSVLLIIV